MKRRELLGYSAVLGASLALPRISAADAPKKETAFVLIHGSWSGAFSFEPLIPYLVEAGHVAIARDLPGHGLLAKFPDSFLHRPLNRKLFATEISPLKEITFEEQCASVRNTISSLKGKFGKIALVAHSSGALIATAVAEAMPENIQSLIYISGLISPPGLSGQDCFRWPEAKSSRMMEIIFTSAFEKIGALRMDSRSENSNFNKKVKEILYPEISAERCRAILNMQGSDTPFSTLNTPIQTSRERWGRIPRAYIHTTKDDVMPFSMQQKIVATMDAFTPENKTVVKTMDCSHTVALVKPEQLAHYLNELVSNS